MCHSAASRVDASLRAWLESPSHFHPEPHAMAAHLIETRDGAVVTLTMNRPEARNAMSGEMMAGFNEALPRLAADQSVRCVVLTGAGNAFCSGGDVKGFAQNAAT